MPSAVPLLPSGASSTAAVTARPFQHTARAVVGTSAVASSHTGASTSRAQSRKKAATTTATVRSGPSLLRTASDHRPAPSLPAPPSTWAAANRPEASPSATPRWSCSSSTMRAAAVNWGTTSRPLAVLSRMSSGSRSTTPWLCEARAAPGGSRMNTAMAAATRAVKALSARKEAGTPAFAAITGSTTAASAAPTGVAVCRMPMARPRRSAVNQLMTARPLAAFTLAPKTPAPNSASPASSAFPVATRARKAAAPIPPMVITSRSPRRSAMAPQGTRVSIVPRLTAPMSRPTCGSVRPKWALSCGVSAGRPRKTAAFVPCASAPTPRTTHR